MRRVMKAFTVATVGLAATAATSQAATLALTPPKACYLSQETATLTGAGFTANAPVTLTEDGQPAGTPTADAAGGFSGGYRFVGLKAVKAHTITATDGTNTASVTFTGTTYQVATKQSTGRAGKKYKLRGYGFLFGAKAYMHVRGHGIRRDMLLARPKAPCGTFVVKRRIVPPTASFGNYKVQFDAKRRYSKKTANALHFTLRVFPRASSAMASLVGAGWTQVR